MKRTSFFFFLSFLCLVASTGNAQQTMQFSGESSLLIKEYVAMVVEEDGALTVAFARPKLNATIDQLEKGDVLLMMNGKRMSTLADLKDQYASIPKGEELKIGIRRGEERFILRTTRSSDDNSSGTVRTITMGSGDGGDANVIAELGLVVETTEEGIVIKQTVPIIMPNELKTEGALEDYVIAEINGKTPESTDDIKAIIKGIDVGSTYTLLLKKGDQSKEVSIKKASSKPTVSSGN
ncbi:MAG: hypothetical protein AAFW89_01340 [Bacteroidota bacterium]